MIAIQKTRTKTEGEFVEVKLTKEDAFALTPLNKFRDNKSANRFVSGVNRKQKLFGKRYFIANAMIKKASKSEETMKGLVNKLQEKFNR
tara:strand:+ start:135 stop:401 length:267 start_codon:yes stop_codon:yes gene_type:complete